MAGVYISVCSHVEESACVRHDLGRGAYLFSTPFMFLSFCSALIYIVDCYYQFQTLILKIRWCPTKSAVYF